MEKQLNLRIATWNSLEQKYEDSTRLNNECLPLDDEKTLE